MGISSDKKLIHSPLCCKTSIQIYYALMDCTGNSPENVFFALGASKILRQLYIFYIAFLLSLLPFLCQADIRQALTNM